MRVVVDDRVYTIRSIGIRTLRAEPATDRDDRIPYLVVRIALAIVSDYFGAMGYDPGSADGQPDDMPDADLNEVDAPADTGADDED